MRAVVQRVSNAFVHVGDQLAGQIDRGLMVLLGVETGDSGQDARYLGDKIAKLRIFSDDQGKMNLSVSQAGGQVLMVSQFTLLGDARGQNRPGFIRAEEPQRANALFEECCERIEGHGIRVEKGVFRAHMQVSLVNDGPVTILLDSRKQF